MAPIRRARDWFADRFGLSRAAEVVAFHPVPEETAGRSKGWMYVLGTATLTAFLLQVVTGIVLATHYVPSPAEAYQSVVAINEQVRYGALLRGLHFFGASAMVVLVTLHMARVFLTGSYKFPRELNWLTGVALLLLTMAMAFTGQLLRWDANGVWGVFVASHYAGRVPLIGEGFKRFILAGETIGGSTLSRFYGFHVVLLPLLIFAIVGAHLYLVLLHGVSEPPKAGRSVDRGRYRGWYDGLLRRSTRRYVPHVAWREAVFAVGVVLAVFFLAMALGPKGPAEPANPTFIPAEPKPDWFLLWYYGLISIKPPRIETFVMVYLPLILIVSLVMLPFLFGTGERSPRRRPGAVIVASFFAIALGTLTELGSRSPWVMAWDTQPLSAGELGVSAGPVWEGAQLFHERGCQYCHVVADRGGSYGPELNRVLRRLPPEIVSNRVVQGFRNMPAYGDILTREELNAIMVFLAAMGER